MKPDLIKISVNSLSSFSVRQDIISQSYCKWHYHQEIEIVLIESGNGYCYIGDHVSPFGKGDVIMIGPGLPHYWRCDDKSLNQLSSEPATALVVHFKEDFWGDAFLSLPENWRIKELFLKAKKGVKVSGEMKFLTARLISRLRITNGVSRLSTLLKCLNLISNDPYLKQLSINNFQSEYISLNDAKIDAIYQYTLENFKNKISLREISQVGNVSSNYFCKYFKTKTNQSFNNFLNEIRVGQACKLIIENTLNHSQICYESGFHNLVNYYKFFKKITGKTPSQYRRSHLLN